MRTAEQILRSRVPIPDAEIPDGRWLELPRRGRTWLTDLPGPTPDAPSVVLLHAVGCTGLLTWYPVLEELNKRYRVVVFDQRWHGQGITSERFLITDCADDVAVVIDELGLVAPVVAGFSMGSIVAQRVWRQHPDAIGGLVLAATTDYFRAKGPAAAFHGWFELWMGLLHSIARSRVLTRRLRRSNGAAAGEPRDIRAWALEEFRSTSPWAVGQAIASLGRFHSTPWLPKVDVPTAVVVTTKDKVLVPSRQRYVASLIPQATVHDAPVGHAGCVLEADAFVPVFLQAVNTTTARIQDARRLKAGA